MSEVRALPVPEGLEGERVDAGLARLFGFSRTRAAEFAAEGRVTLDGTRAGKSDRLHEGQWLEVELPEPAAAAVAAPPQAVPGLRVIHDDDDVVVVDKPVGVAAHPSPGWTGTTVVQGLAAAGYRVSTSGAAERQGIVHRLDVGTSGVMVVAKSEPAYSVLKHAFRERTVDKVYHAVAQGHLDPLRGTIDAPIDRHPVHDYRWAVVAGGKESVTHYDTIEAFPAASLLEVHLETGRTHQIRVHLSALRHPCVGDLTYGADPTLAAKLGLQRQWLHAVRLSFEHPSTGQRVTFESPYPPDLAHALHILRGPP
jgi:23S rRNA pseudouridine1911/1915/1917 synthase